MISILCLLYVSLIVGCIRRAEALDASGAWSSFTVPFVVACLGSERGVVAASVELVSYLNFIGLKAMDSD